jgi:hypothetical protein
VDPAASRALFEEAVDRLTGSKMLSRRDWKIISADYPDLVVDLPHPSGVRRLFRLRCDGWNEQAPSVKPIDAEGNVLEGQPIGSLFQQLSAGWGLCAAGTREYHAHHQENPWSAHQAKTTLGDVLFTLAQSYAKGPTG